MEADGGDSSWAADSAASMMTASWVAGCDREVPCGADTWAVVPLVEGQPESAVDHDIVSMVADDTWIHHIHQVSVLAAHK